MIQKTMAELTRSEPEKYIPCPLSVCVAMRQGCIGYDLQSALREELLDRGIEKGVATVLTQVEVDPADPAFAHPTKPIGAFMTKEKADKLIAERDYQVIDKDFASCVLAQQLETDTLIILTAVEKAAVNFGNPNQKWRDRLTPEEAEGYMLPKVQAAVEFAKSAPGRSARVTLLEKARNGVAGRTGTVITANPDHEPEGAAGSEKRWSVP